MKQDISPISYVLLLFVVLFVISLFATGCAQPHDGVDGTPGERGLPGLSGNVGAVGPAGADGKIATVVNLCPGAPVYGSVYVETALCINNELYAVYSQNGGFLTLLTPGAYSSNAIGSACNLTVLPSCQVTN